MSRRPFTVLVGIDPTMAALHAVRQAARFCQEAAPDAQLHICHALPAGKYDTSGFTEAVAEARAGGYEAIVHTASGDPSTELVRLAASLETDLLLIGSAGRGALADALRGTVGVETLAHCPCPVVLVP